MSPAEFQAGVENSLLAAYGWKLRAGSSSTWVHPDVAYRCTREHALMRIRLVMTAAQNVPATAEIAAESDESYEASEGLIAARENISTEEVRS